MVIRESGLNFEFSEKCQVIKFDDTEIGVAELQGYGC